MQYQKKMPRLHNYRRLQIVGDGLLELTSYSEFQAYLSEVTGLQG